MCSEVFIYEIMVWNYVWNSVESITVEKYPSFDVLLAFLSSNS